MVSNLMFFLVLWAEDWAVYFSTSQAGIKDIIPYLVYTSDSLVPLVTASHWDLCAAALVRCNHEIFLFQSYCFPEEHFVFSQKSTEAMSPKCIMLDLAVVMLTCVCFLQNIYIFVLVTSFWLEPSVDSSSDLRWL